VQQPEQNSLTIDGEGEDKEVTTPAKQSPADITVAADSEKLLMSHSISENHFASNGATGCLTSCSDR